MALLWRVFVTNAAVLLAATLVLVLTPATVSFPVAAREAVVLGAGLMLLLGLDFLLLRRAVGRDALDRVRGLLAAQERERVRIARELHDEVGQALTAVLLSLDRARTDEQLAQAREATRAALDDVRAIVRRLRPEALDDLGLTSALAALSVSVQTATGLRVERELLASGGTLSDEEELVAYRVAQEAVTNAVQHADAEHLRMRLIGAGEKVELRISDDGVGYEGGRARERLGIAGMRERALLCGGELSVESEPGAGTRVTLRADLPMRVEMEANDAEMERCAS